MSLDSNTATPEPWISSDLAQAVLLVCYEFLQGQDDVPEHSRQTATREDMEAMYGHLQDTMHLIGYTDAVRGRHTMRLWRAMLDRALMSSSESRMFRGFLRQVKWKVERGGGAAASEPGAEGEV